MPAPKVFRIETQDHLGNRDFITRDEKGYVWCETASGVPAALSFAGIPFDKESETRWALKNAKTGKDALAIVKALQPSIYTAKLIA